MSVTLPLRVATRIVLQLNYLFVKDLWPIISATLQGTVFIIASPEEANARPRTFLLHLEQPKLRRLFCSERWIPAFRRARAETSRTLLGLHHV